MKHEAEGQRGGENAFTVPTRTHKSTTRLFVILRSELKRQSLSVYYVVTVDRRNTAVGVASDSLNTTRVLAYSIFFLQCVIVS